MRSQMFIITIIIYIIQKPVHDRTAENQPTAGLSSLNEYVNENKYENGMGKSETELLTKLQQLYCVHKFESLYYSYRQDVIGKF